MNRKLVLGLALGAMLFTACGEEAPPPTTTVAEATPPAEAPPPSPAAPTADQLAVPEDFEERAQTEVTAANYRDQLAAIEAEQAPAPAAP